MKHLSIFILVLLSYSANSQDKLISYTVIDSFEIAEIEQLAQDLGVPSVFLSFNYAVDLYKLIYNTIDPHGEPTIASGAIAIPRDIRCALPIASYQHGTIALKTAVPSNFSEEANIGLLYATDGYIVAMPDYLGLGESPGLHPYVHADSEASAVVDMLFASRELLDDFEKNYNEQLFLFGYSQGGHATVAAHRLIQNSYADEWVVTASNPMSGPYDVSGVQAEVITANAPYPTPSYLPYVLFAYQNVYGNLFSDPSEVFIAPYDNLLPGYFEGNHSTGEINALLPSVPNQILQPAVLDSFRNDPNHRFRQALALNNLYDWKPAAPVRLSYCTGDDQVGFLNSFVARDTFIANGATDIELMDFGAFDHFNCVQPALISGLFWFNTFRTDQNNLVVEDVIVTPESAANANDGSIDVSVSGGVGTLSYNWSNGATGASISGLTGNAYSVTISDETACSIEEVIEITTLSTSLDQVAIDQIVTIYPNPAQEWINIEFNQSGNFNPIHFRSATPICKSFTNKNSPPT